MQNYRARPGGACHSAARREYPLRIEAREGEKEPNEKERQRSGEGGQEGPAAPQPTSTSGLVKVSAAGPTLLVPLLFRASSFFSLLPPFLSSSSSSFPLVLPPSPIQLNVAPYRIIASYHVGTHALLRVLLRVFSLPSDSSPTKEPAKSQLVEIPGRYQSATVLNRGESHGAGRVIVG